MHKQEEETSLLTVNSYSYTPEEILQLRKQITAQFYQETNAVLNGMILSFNDAAIQRLFLLYDNFFFHSFFQFNGPRDICFRYNGRLTSSAGLTKVSHLSRQKNPLNWHYDISISKPLLKSFHSPAVGVTVNGITPDTQLEAMQLVLEHELCHVIEFLAYRNSNCHRKRFRALAMQLFGHTDVVHTLRGTHIPQRSFLAGETVCFHYNSILYHGTIARITKRATVMVPDRTGDYQDRTGQRYRKYYVPLGNLQKCKERLT